jgi:alpha-D-ribose 1-methylphosphonate 5-triphosphate diphosphatase PhnM
MVIRVGLPRSPSGACLVVGTQVDLHARHQRSTREVIATDHEQHLLSVASYDKQTRAEVENLINRRRTLDEIRYESLSGGGGYRVVLGPAG